MKVGIDIVEVKRFNKMTKDKAYMDKVYTEYEQKYIAKVAENLPRMAGIFSAKEAVVKTLGIGLFGGLMLTDIEVRHDDRGKPYVVASDKLMELVHGCGCSNIEISISHTKDIATAICILN